MGDTVQTPSPSQPITAGRFVFPFCATKGDVFTAPLAVDDRIAHSNTSARLSDLATGLEWMGRYDQPEGGLVLATGARPFPTLDGIDVQPARLCTEHLSELGEDLRCPSGHQAKTWYVRTGGHIQFDAHEFNNDPRVWKW